MWGGSSEEIVQKARLVLKFGSQAQKDELFQWYQIRRADGRWGLENPLDEILGALRVAALKSLHGPPGKEGEHHEAAVPILWAAGKPRDLPLLTRLLAAAHPDRTTPLCWAIDKALEDCTEHHPALIAILEGIIARATQASPADDPARTLGQYAIPEAEEALDRLRLRVDPWPRVPVLTALLWRSPEKHRAEAQALAASLEGTDGPGTENHGPYLYYLNDALGDEAPAVTLPEPSPDLALWPDEDAEWAARLAPAAPQLPATSLLAALPGASAYRTSLLLAAISRVATHEGHSFFRAVWPLTSSDNDEIAELAIRACAATDSQQAIQRLKTRQRKALAAGDTRAASLLEQGLAAGHQIYMDHWMAG